MASLGDGRAQAGLIEDVAEAAAKRGFQSAPVWPEVFREVGERLSRMGEGKLLEEVDLSMVLPPARVQWFHGCHFEETCDYALHLRAIRLAALRVMQVSTQGSPSNELDSAYGAVQRAVASALDVLERHRGQFDEKDRLIEGFQRSDTRHWLKIAKGRDERAAAAWAGQGTIHAHARTMGRRDHLLRAICTHLAAEKAHDVFLIDYGCGRGRLLDALAHVCGEAVARRFSYVGVDVNSTYVEALQREVLADEYPVGSFAFRVRSKGGPDDELQNLQQRAHFVVAANVFHELSLDDLAQVVRDCILVAAWPHAQIIVSDVMTLSPSVGPEEERYVFWYQEDLDALFRGLGLEPRIAASQTPWGDVPYVQCFVHPVSESVSVEVPTIERARELCMAVWRGKLARDKHELECLTQKRDATGLTQVESWHHFDLSRMIPTMEADLARAEQGGAARP